MAGSFDSVDHHCHPDGSPQPVTQINPARPSPAAAASGRRARRGV